MSTVLPGSADALHHYGLHTIIAYAVTLQDITKIGYSDSMPSWKCITVMHSLANEPGADGRDALHFGAKLFFSRVSMLKLDLEAIALTIACQAKHYVAIVFLADTCL